MLLIPIFLVLIDIAVICVILSVFITKRSTVAIRGKKATPFKVETALFLLVLALELIVGYHVNYVNKMIMTDAYSRVANAFYVFYISPPHLAAIGFVWTPLPSFLELPFLLLWALYKPLASSALAGVIVTALFSAGTATLIYKNCKHFGVSAVVSLFIVLLYSFNPYIFLYGLNGMSESILIFFIFLAVTQLTQWFDDGAPFHLLWIAIALVLGFLTRYEAVPFAIAILISIALVSLARRRQQAIGNSRYSFFEGTSLVVFLPLAVTAGLWILVNYIIMGDPFYFLRSNYSNQSQSLYIQSPAILALLGNAVNVIKYIAKESSVFAPLIAIILAIRLFTKRLFQWETLMFLVLILAIPCLQYVMLIRGSSYGWLRFFVYPLPIAVAWLPYELRKLKQNSAILRNSMIVLCLVSLIFTGVLTGKVMFNSSFAPEEYATYRANTSDLQVQRDVADFINQNIDGSTLLLDSIHTGYIILNLNSTGNVITDSSYTFNDAVIAPKDYNVEYILTTDPQGLGAIDEINSTYPTLYTDGAAWCTLVKAFDGYKLYKLN